MQKLIIEKGKGTADIGDFFLEVHVDEVGEDNAICIDYELLDVEECWHAKGSFNPDALHELIEGLQIIARTFGIVKPEKSLFLYNGEAGRA